MGPLRPEGPRARMGSLRPPGAVGRAENPLEKSGEIYLIRELARYNFQYSEFSKQKAQYTIFSYNINIHDFSKNNLNFQTITAALFAWERRPGTGKENTFLYFPVGAA